MVNEGVIPSPNPGTAPYWKAAGQHQLVLPQCGDCGRFHSYPRSRCPFCRSERLQWKACAGTGTIYAATQVFRAPHKSFTSTLPYWVAVVTLDEGPHLMTQLVNAGAADVQIGQRVTVVFEDLNDEISLPRFNVLRS